MNFLKVTLIATMILFYQSVNAQEQQEVETWQPPVDGYIGQVKRDKKSPMPLPPINPEDISYSKRVWQEIDGRLSVNRGIVSPTNSLITVLMKAIKDGQITAYDPTPNPDNDDPNGDSFKTRLSASQALTNLSGIDSVLVEVFDENGEVTSQSWVASEFDPEQVFLFRIKEDWIFDEKRSVFEPRIIGIAPLVIPKLSQDIELNQESFYDTEFGDIGDDEIDGTLSDLSESSISEFDAFNTQLDAQPAFWLYFPEIRDVLVNQIIPNDYNDADGISFDDFFIGRHFNSYIVKVSNSRDLRIKDYKKSKVEQLQESERIKRQLMNYQSDLYRN